MTSNPTSLTPDAWADLVWDGTGVWLRQRRLHQDSFVWPKAGDTVCPLSETQWNWLIAGVDWTRLAVSDTRAWVL
ncbi:MAG: uncharacterized protein JWP34_3152 [Massilia sp.]|nr:uncharacterized protein [Massilia sp.]